MSLDTPIAQLLAKYTASLPPCCLRVHPEHKDIIFLGTYDLQKESGQRLGSVEVLRYDVERGNITLLNSIPTPSAILDLKFNPFNSSQFVTVHSTGNMTVWSTSDELVISQLHNAELFDDTNLITSVFFSPILENQLCVTLTGGPAGVVVEMQAFSTTHDMESWTCAFGGFQGLENVVFSGGDDSKLIAHDIRTAEYGTPIFQSRRIHDVGIVAILPATPGTNGRDSWRVANPYSLWTGSYDDNVKALDLRVLPPQELIPSIPPLVKQANNLGGGVWRLIPSPLQDDDRVLTCCMYDGARILEPGRGLAPSRYFKGTHESMCYGGDWSPDADYVVTCSFYDNVVQVWSPSSVE
ncbi:hypothetical protein BABINDRAFT_172624 [Babjeviella inositovora NRRL Y-12698]|uniref:methylated diphthine methylhydrolase n=1 Tax=Babjeviella inositovora NRRL Y-12698 TaxID=984486 RepID=A0A1E3QJQ8_9ASCO|nr:uncharacterized protein BABINDRAFT_172624 [Babjeviella inositovora NRRL Y-12698]ODQ77858.1 hypothetical protein BABINDRAFT_172624 [Babjeviella inositovora NRRL Y-12698]